MKTATEQRIEDMRNGKKLKCPRCETGFVSAIGNPETTKVFKCNVCGTGIVLTIPYRPKE